LETIRYCKELGLATICGLSNISFGMPQRSYVNAAFLTLAIQAGLTMAIANPSQDLITSCALAADLLLNKEGADIRYIDAVASLQEKDKSAEVSAAPVLPDHLERLHSAVIKGDRKGIASITQKALNDGEDPQKLLDDGLLPAINLVGDYFDQGKYFLPQLIASAEAMKNAIAVLEPFLLKTVDSKKMPVAVMATVEGDIHDIGKNLVVLMLKNYGFQVIDLGKDVPAERIVSTAKEHNARIIGLSALMTTTMQRMRDVIELVKKDAPEIKVMIGGAVITEEFAEEICADGYGKDAAGAVRTAMSLLDFIVKS
jgi:5-methyltetrahydrofolate--homocysteine methyltransferase